MANAVKNGLNLSVEDLALTEAMYDGEIRYTDDTLRLMFLELEKLGFLDNYLVVVTSDHGEEFGEHGGLIHPATLYEELLRVPLIVKGRPAPEGKVDTRLVSSVDITPTVLRSAGLQVPEHMQGRDLLAEAPHSQDGKAVFAQYGNFRYAVRTRDWKLIQNMNPASVELYGLATDHKEQRNLASKMPQKVEVLQKRLAEWKAALAQGASQGDESIRLSREEIENLKSLGYLR